MIITQSFLKNKNTTFTRASSYFGKVHYNLVIISRILMGVTSVVVRKSWITQWTFSVKFYPMFLDMSPRFLIYIICDCVSNSKFPLKVSLNRRTVSAKIWLRLLGILFHFILIPRFNISIYSRIAMFPFIQG